MYFHVRPSHYNIDWTIGGGWTKKEFTCLHVQSDIILIYKVVMVTFQLGIIYLHNNLVRVLLLEVGSNKYDQTVGERFQLELNCCYHRRYTSQ